MMRYLFAVGLICAVCSTARAQPGAAPILGSDGALKTQVPTPTYSGPETILSVKIIELSRSTLAEHGVDLNLRSALTNHLKSEVDIAYGAFPSYVLKPEHAALKKIDAWIREGNGAARILSTHKLTTKGGYVGVNLPDGFPSLTPYDSDGGTNGIGSPVRARMKFATVVTKDGRVHMQACPTYYTMINGQSVPGLNLRDFTATGHMQPGEKILMTGMTSARQVTLKSGVAGLIGKERTERSELLIVVTPEVVATDAPRTADDASPERRAALLAAREAELKALQSEIARLRESLGIGKTLLRVEARIIEISHDALRKSGFDSQHKSVLYAFMDATEKHDPDAIPVIAIKPESRLMKQLDVWLADPAKPAKVLANPTLVTPLGEPASMHVGGEFPIVVPSPDGTLTTEYRRHGTQLDATGTLLEDGTIDLLVRPRHSELDESRSVTIHGQKVPGLVVKECETRIKIAPQETVALGGRIQSRTTPKKPARLLQKTEHVVRESELIVILTVDLIEPKPAHPTPELKTARPATTPAR